MQIIDYDDMGVWGPLVGAAMLEIAPAGMLQELKSLRPEFIEDAEDFIRKRVGRDIVVDHLNRRLSSHSVRVYHGTRLTDPEVERIRAEGLRPLILVDRRSALVSIFEHHKRWAACESRLDSVLHDIGAGQRAGRREDGCIHVCFSRAGLVRGCNHYLKYGAEVDGHVAHALFGDESAHPLLRRNRRAKLVTFLAPFSEAAQAANPYGFPKTDMPALLGMLLRTWAYHESMPKFTVASLKDGTAARFSAPILAHRIEAIQDVSDAELGIKQR